MIFHFHRGEGIDTYIDTDTIIAVSLDTKLLRHVVKVYLKNGHMLEAYYKEGNDKDAKKDFDTLLNQLKERTGNGESNIL